MLKCFQIFIDANCSAVKPLKKSLNPFSLSDPSSFWRSYSSRLAYMHLHLRCSL